MNRTVIGVFKSRGQADKAVDEFRTKGISERDISVVAREEKARGGEGGGERGSLVSGVGGERLRSGVATGGALGGLAGILAGVGALAVPGIGPIVAAGPVAAGLTGALTGGVAGGLVDLGIPEERGRYYEGRVREGDIVVAVKADERKVEEAAQIMRRNGASDVETH
ncbi:MAG: general stress protein [Firmicutes bacterium]|jgi:hypothetical protein|nr:general stress protein [Bacillota bacterium]